MQAVGAGLPRRLLPAIVGGCLPFPSALPLASEASALALI